MKTFAVSAVLALGLSTTAMAQTEAGFGPLVSAAEVQTLAAGEEAPLVLDIRGAAYDQGHIAGAVSAPYERFRGPAENPGALVPEDQLEATLQELGVTLERPVVVVHQGKDDSDFGAAARVYWTLKSSGVSQLAILNGGMAAWGAAGLPLETKATVPTPSDIDIAFSDRWLATTDDVSAIVNGERQARLVDARPAGFFEGRQAHAAMSRPGTLPGAENLAHSVWFDGGVEVMNAPAANEVLARLGIGRDEGVVAFCNTGHWAATEWFALSELAGVEDVKLYPESMVGWSQTGQDMENTPGLVRNLLNQLRGN
ncbi:sulfurtransferase [Frigidibacter albus]|uniref:Sulfurtransferase n=1 Tax=Frigidibacter albus TaxID=1465486 RepID=A0A6L8VDY8_9RHOB|nr:rhodanese-like domain-containing protein [Frigidibacter albus]MZQ88463.1 sulfurtransferase [Frigidibacter albus]NBE30728.1 sulfurtransferase [Frigidibacter albus]GGH48433.1 sulfurtransferase [Frigidibacter albus]